MAAQSSAKRRFMRMHLILSVLYIALVLLASWFVPDDAKATPMVIFWAVLPGLVVIGWIWNMGRYLMEMSDEYLRLLEIRKILVATGLTLAVSAGWGIIELFAAVPRLPVFFVFPIWCLGLMVGQIVNRLTMGGDTGGCP